MRLKKEKREEMKRKILEFLKNAEGHIASIPMLARAIRSACFLILKFRRAGAVAQLKYTNARND